MDLKFILKLAVVFYFAIHTPVFGEEALILPVIEGSHSVGNDQNNLGINAYKKGKFNQALRHFQVASVVDRKKGEIFFRNLEVKAKLENIETYNKFNNKILLNKQKLIKLIKNKKCNASFKRLEEKHSNLIDAINKDKKVTDETDKALRAAIEEFKGLFS